MKIKSKNGAVAVYALLSITVFIAIVFSVYVVVNLRHKNQLKTAEDIKRDAEQYITDSNIEIVENPRVIYIYDEKHLELMNSGTYVFIPEENKIFKFTVGAEYIFFSREREDVAVDEEMLNGANLPDLDGFNQDTTYYVTWNTTSSPYAIIESTKISEEAPTSWSDYNEGVNQWANIKTTGGGNDCYWVWIPRYAYKVPTANRNVAEEIDIKFLPGKSSTPVGEARIINTTPTPGSWVVHPAFTNIGNGGFGELRGIWVAKYEASIDTVGEIGFAGILMSGDTASLEGTGGGAYTNQQIRVKPNVTSWRGINANGIFDATRNMTNVTNTNSSLVGARGIDSHLIKNTEWGAVAYLSNSKYGKNSRVWNNSFYNGTTYGSPITGLAGDHATNSVTSTATMNRYNTTGGVRASTTGNVYGVYDMAGGAWEKVAGYLSAGTGPAYSRFTNAEEKHKDKYEGTSADSVVNYNLNANKYGDAVYETSLSGLSDTGSWDATNSNFLNISNKETFMRGGHANGGASVNIFAFTNSNGGNVVRHGFRPALVNGQ